MFLNDAMEIDRADVTLLEVLGEGAFGLVRRGLYNDGKVGVREVAVKMLKEHPPLDDERAFRREIEVMKSVEPHPNIVGIIGHCTKPSHQMLLLTEYCSFGNLLDFLRDEWKYLYELNVKTSGSILKRKFGGLSRTSGKKRHRRVSHNLTETHHQSTGSEGNSNSNSIDHPNSNCTDRPNDYKSRGNGSGSFGGVLGNSGASIDGNIVESLKFRYKYLNTLQQQQQQQQQQQTPTTSIYPPSYDISATTTMTSITTINDSAPPPPPTPLQSPTSYWAADNKSYGYEDICCRACKYHMNVDSVGKKHATSLNGVDVGVGVNGDHTTMQQIGCEKQKQIHEFHSKNCVCQQKLLNANQTVVTQQQHHHQQQQQQQEQPLEQQAFGSVAGPKSAGAIENKSYFKLFHEILSEAAWRRRQWERRHARAAFCNRRLAFTGVHIESSTTTTTTTTTPTPTPTPTTTAASIISQADKTGDNEALSSCLHRQPLTTADLLDIARQVAVGMEYLAKNKVVHRDLAARNVLVATDRTIKIADFGLSRDVYQENIYKKTGNGKLPIKWLALESMTHQVYTTQSDVWSYGILLYEIVTLGSTPYPSTPTNRLLNLLKSGYRMERPKNCGPEFYNLMYACWNVNPCERPTFSEIIKILNDFLLDEPERHGTLLGLPNMECYKLIRLSSSFGHKNVYIDTRLVEILKSMEQCASRLLNLHKEEQPKQEIEETPQSSPDDDKMIDTSNMDDSYLKPLQAKNKSTND
ncbi:unnamed protein product [Ceratitis capitata]|uniref:receptor protein-tyrosine kinase n=1 Tax=Ceratitis capitata TaxID=7213 RepID=A0A811VCM0_CERCA|nr:unnamed protein product [Ceratitis capitata]